MRFLELVVALAAKEFEQRRPKLTSRKRRKINSRTHEFIHESVARCVTRCLVSRGTVDLIRYTEYFGKPNMVDVNHVNHVNVIKNKIRNYMDRRGYPT